MKYFHMSVFTMIITAFIMKVVRGMASIRRLPIALDTNVPEQTTVNT